MIYFGFDFCSEGHGFRSRPTDSVILAHICVVHLLSFRHMSRLFLQLVLSTIAILDYYLFCESALPFFLIFIYIFENYNWIWIHGTLDLLLKINHMLLDGKNWIIFGPALSIHEQTDTLLYVFRYVMLLNAQRYWVPMWSWCLFRRLFQLVSSIVDCFRQALSSGLKRCHTAFSAAVTGAFSSLGTGI